MTNGPLVARTRRVDHELDLLALAGGDGVLLERARAGMAGRGVARRVPVGQADAALAEIGADDEVGLPGSGAVAFGALPFHPNPSAPLVIPQVIWGSHPDHGRWVTTVASPDAPEPDVVALCQPRGDAAPQPSAHTSVQPVRPEAWWCELVSQATRAMRDAGPDGLRKVVLAREVVVEADVPFDRAHVLAQLRRSYPDCFVFHVDGFVGASPELLVGRSDDVVRAQPMAGTAPRGDDDASDDRLRAELAASPTYRREHQITIDMVHDTLLPWCSYLDYEAEPSIVGVANVQHLATMVEGRLSHPAPSVLELVAALHPTPAVNGLPREVARAWIEEHEGLDRGHYGGTVGWVDARGNGTFAVSIRCAEIDGPRAHLYAGNGIVSDSDPATELAETELKLQAMLAALTTG